MEQFELGRLCSSDINRIAGTGPNENDSCIVSDQEKESALSVQVANPVAEAPGGAPERKPEGAARLISVDAFRGLVMVLMLAEVMHLPEVAQAFPHSIFWRVIGFNTQHVEWQGCSLHDLIQPAFSFLVGAALPFSVASRRMKGQAFGSMLGHAIRRALILVFLGIFLRSLRSTQTYFTFEDTLTQIGLGYVFLFLLAFTRPRTQVVVLVLILICFWAAFALYPAPGPQFDYARVGVPADWSHNYSGFLSHWNKNSNLSWAFDVWFLNLFPREQPFVFNEGGWSTLSFIPTLATMILGLLTGEWLKGHQSKLQKLRGLVIAGTSLVLLGLVLQWAGICPIVKRVWTSSYTLYSGGLVILLLAGFYALIELHGWRRWAFPLLVVGMNSIAAYVMSWTMSRFFGNALDRHLGKFIAAVSGPTMQPVLHGFAVLMIFWSILFWMYRRKIFLRI
jgi:heparan-alpha-glucosaminide N-acetyltransferase